MSIQAESGFVLGRHDLVMANDRIAEILWVDWLRPGAPKTHRKDAGWLDYVHQCEVAARNRQRSAPAADVVSLFDPGLPVSPQAAANRLHFTDKWIRELIRSGELGGWRDDRGHSWTTRADMQVFEANRDR